MDKRTKQLNIRLSVLELEVLRDLAETSGLKVSDVIRLAVRKYARGNRKQAAA